MAFYWIKTSSLHVIKTSLFILLLGLSHSVLAQSVETLSVQYRAAEEDIASQIKSLYPENEVRVVGRGQQLTVRADTPTINEIKQLVTSLDIAPHQFLISVASDTNRQQQNKGFSGSLSTSSSTSDNSSITIKTHNTSHSTRGSEGQSIRVLEGHSAFINAGQKKPIRERQLINGQWESRVDYIDMTSGFYIEPRMMGSDQVELKIRTQQNKASSTHPNTVDTATIDSVQIVQLGEWATIGGMSQDSKRRADGISYSTERHSVDNQSITIKVELVANE